MPAPLYFSSPLRYAAFRRQRRAFAASASRQRILLRDDAFTLSSFAALPAG